MYFVLVLIAVALASLKFLQDYFWNIYRYWDKRGIKGPIPLPIFGNFLETLLKPGNEVEEQRLLKYGRIYGTFEFSQPMLTIADPVLIREIAIKQFHNFTNRHNRVPCDAFLNKTMFLKKDESWRSLRQSLSPVFTSNKIKTMFYAVSECSENAVEYIQNIEGKEVILKDLITAFTMDVITKCAFGVDTDSYKDPNNEFLRRAQKAAKVSPWRIFMALFIPTVIQRQHKIFAFSFFDENDIDYFSGMLRAIINNRKKSVIERNDFVNLMLRLEDSKENVDSNHQMTDISDEWSVNVADEKSSVNQNKRVKLDITEILATSFTFFVAGYESTATLINFTLYAIAMNPDIQARLHKEIDERLGYKEELDYDEVNSLTYLDAVINESLRMYPPVLVFDRVAAEDIVVHGIKIEKGTVVNLPFYAIQHDSKYFPEPHVFKPERFLPENSHSIVPYTFIPFGVGPRICIGMRFTEMTAKVFLIKLLRKFEIIRTKRTPETPKYTTAFGSLTCEPIYGAFKSRQQKHNSPIEYSK